MKLLVTVILECTLFSSAACLQCYQCIQNSTAPCTQTTTTCAAGQTTCAALTTSVTGVGQTTKVNIKSCAEPTGCGEPISINFGVLGRTTVNSACCSTDLCNTQNVNAYTDNTPNSHWCFFCDTEDCTKTKKCLGAEDRCIKSSVTVGSQTIVVKGCATSNICSTLPPQEILHSTGLGFSCCEGYLCNNAKHTGQSLFLLLASLAPIALFL